MEVDISKELETIKTEKYGETVVSGITDALDVLVDKKFKTVDLSEEKTVMKSSPYGDKIKQSILDSLYKLSKVESVEPVETEYFTTEQPFSILNNLKRCEIPEGTKIIDENAFKDADSLQVVEIPEGVETIGSWAFKGCESLEELVLPASLIRGTEPNGSRELLCECYGLKKLIIQNPGDLTIELPMYRVKAGRSYDSTTGTYTQTYVTYHGPDGIGTTGRKCYLYYLTHASAGTIDYKVGVGLESVTLPDNMDCIYAGMFDGCFYLDTINIPETVKAIGTVAFRNCHKITSDRPFRNVEYLGSGALACTGIETFDTSLYGYSTYISGSVLDPLVDGPLDLRPEYYTANVYLKSVHIDSTRTTNGDSYDEHRSEWWRFRNCTALESIDFPIQAHSNIKENFAVSIGGLPSIVDLYTPDFENCYNLEYLNFVGDGFTPTAGEVKIPYADHITSIHAYVFRNCRKIKKMVDFDKTLGSYPPLVQIWQYAFDGSGLVNFYIPPTCKSVGQYAFANCQDLSKVDIDPESCLWAVTKGDSSHHVFYGCSSLTSFDIPFKWTVVPNYAFMNCTSLSSISFGTASVSVTTIGTHAFDNTGFTTISLPSTVKTFSESVFANCANLTSADVSNVTTLSYRTFENCTALTSVTLPSTVTSLGYYFFANTGFTSFTVQSSITSIGQDCFNGCQHLTTVTALGTRTISARAFANCPALTEVNISSSITNSGINQNAFAGCDGITFNIDRKPNTVSGYATGWGATNFTINWTGTT